MLRRCARARSPASTSDRIRIETDPSISPGLALVDAPDIDSVEHANRELADHLVEAADLCLFVTTATRYADRVPWLVLGRVRERGLPLVVVVNRLPAEPDDRREVLDDVERLFAEAGLGRAAGATATAAELPLEVVGVTEGEVEPAREALVAAAVEPVMARIAHLRADRDARIELAARALAGSLAGLGPLVDQIADDVAHEAIDAAAARRTAATYYDRGLGAVREAVSRGTFLREEALRHWQDYVGADDITRIFSKGIGAVRGAIASIFRPSRAPVAEVREATTDDLVAVARLHAAEAARRTASAWSEDRALPAAVAADPSLWGPSPDFDARLRERLDEWITSIGTDIAETGEGKRRLARGASIGVNAIGVGVMLATFIHTAGLTGTEVGVAAATAFLNQKLLGALFGEAAMVELVGRARRRLEEALATTFAEERRGSRTWCRLPRSSTLAADLHAAADELRQFRRRAARCGRDVRRTGDDEAAGAERRQPGGRRRRVTGPMSVAEPRPPPRPRAALPAGPGPPIRRPGLGPCLAAPGRAIAAPRRSASRPRTPARSRADVAERLGFPAEAYVLALVGGTGVGKSSLLNALAGAEVSDASVRRPTTAQPGRLGAEAEPPRAGRPPRLAGRARGPVARPTREALGDVAILDLPDLDSIERRPSRARRGDPAARRRGRLGDRSREVRRRGPARRVPRATGCRAWIARSSS